MKLVAKATFLGVMRAIVRRVIEAANAQDFDVFDQLMPPELAQQAKVTTRWIHATFEGHHFDLVDMDAEGDKVITRITRAYPQTYNQSRIAATTHIL